MRLPITLLALAAALLIGACSSISVNVVPTSSDTASDAASAQNQMPNIAGYTSTDADSIVDAITAVGGSSSLITGNVPLAAAIAKIDSLIQCYQNVGAVSARVYTDANIANVISGDIPKVGALAIINRERVANNLLTCALNTGFSAQAAAIEPCVGSGTFQRQGATFDYVFAATDPALCTTFESALR